MVRSGLLGSVTGLAAALAVAPCATPMAAAAAPQPERALVDAALIDAVRAHLDNEIVTLSVRSQNTEHEGIGRSEIERLDNRWRAERQADNQPLIAATLANPLSNYLTRIQAHSLGLFTEIFVMDAHGLNVGQSNITSDFWQGDEAKFRKTFPEGPGTVFLDEAEYHEASGTWRIQLNLSLDDPGGTGVIGAATFEINLTELQRRETAR
jgi:hypothetical protein